MRNPDRNRYLAVDGGADQSATLAANGTATFTLSSPSAAITLHAVYAVQGNTRLFRRQHAARQSGRDVGHYHRPDRHLQQRRHHHADRERPGRRPDSSSNITLAVNGASPVSANLATDGIATFTLTSLNAGDYRLHAEFATQGNYFGSSADGTLTIDRASSTTTTVGDGPFTYDGTEHAGGSGTVTGAGGLSAAATSVTYSSNSDGTGTADQIDAGTSTTAHYAGDANHLPG